MISLFTAEGMAGFIFLVFIILTVSGALIATNSSSLIRSVAGLALCFVGVAGLYYYLGSPFVALLQILIYVGAVCVTIIFAVMLANNAETKRSGRCNILATSLSLLSGSGIIFALVTIVLKTEWFTTVSKPSDGSVEKLGQSLLTTYGMSFELISVILLVAIVGSLVLAKSGRSQS